MKYKDSIKQIKKKITGQQAQNKTKFALYGIVLLNYNKIHEYFFSLFKNYFPAKKAKNIFRKIVIEYKIIIVPL